MFVLYERDKMKKITYEVANERFVSQGRVDIELCEDGFEGWKKKSKFFDKVIGEYFWSIPKNVFVTKSAHTKRAMEKRKQTNIKKYGNACSLHGEQTRSKTKKTLMEKYGVEFVFQAKEVREKVKHTVLERYGVDNVSKLDVIKEKKKNTCLKRYGVEHQWQSKLVKGKIKQTNLEKFGFENPNQSSIVKAKKKKTFLARYNVEQPFALPGVYKKRNKTMLKLYGTTNSWLNIDKQIPELEQTLKSWYLLQPEPKPMYSNFCSKFIGQVNVSLLEAQEALSVLLNNRTELETFAEKLFETTHYNRSPKEIQKLYRPDFKLGPQIFVNVDGLYWHSELHKNQKYHFDMRKEFEENNLRILQFHEDEVYQKSNIVMSIVNNILHRSSEKVYARKTICKVVPHKLANEFLINNHLMGSTKAKHIGLFIEGSLVSLLSYKHKKHVCKIERFCSAVNSSVVGGFSKLLAFLERSCLKSETTEIHNWVDLRYGTGDHLETKGFFRRKETLGWKWSDGTNTFNRLKCRANMDERKMSEKHHAKELGWYRIYDAGQRLWVRPIITR